MSRVRISPKWLSNCTGKELQQLNRLRLKETDSMMYEDVIQCPHENNYRSLIRVFLAREDSRIVGWSCVILPPPRISTTNRLNYAIPVGTKNIPIYTYVNRAYRGRKLGKRLLTTAAKYVIGKRKRYKPTVFFWNEASSALFAGMREGFPKLQVYDVSEWWDIYDN